MISHIMTLANGIIGVSVLAMPFCFKQCGIVLATLMLLLSSILSRLACHFLIKSAVMSRRRNFEFLAFHAFGPMGKFLVELCIIGFLLGTCIAFFVVLGDLGPQIVGEMINKSPEDIRTSFLITTGIFIVLPLGLLRNIDSLASVSTASIAFYICLVLKVVAESTHHIFAADWFDKVNFWRPGGILQCLPIFALALFCQTQLFEIYEAMPNATLEKMNQVVQGALNICTLVYFCMGCFGYIAFCTQPFTGNILMTFEPNFSSEIIKIGFVLSVAFSFPLVIFPCRASLNSLLFRRGYAYEATTSYITEARFRSLTTFIVTVALTVGVLIPNIEFVLGIVGSTIGIIICLIFPAAFFISISTKNTNERLLAQIIVFIGTSIMVLGTYANLYAIEQSSNLRVTTTTTMKLPSQINNLPHILVNNEMLMKPDNSKQSDNLLNIKDDTNSLKVKLPAKPPDNENVRREPPVPVERLPETEKVKDKEGEVLDPVTVNPKIQEIVDKISNMDNELINEANRAYDSLKKVKEKSELPLKSVVDLEPIKDQEKINPLQKNDVIAVDAIKKEESELAAEKVNNMPLDRNLSQVPANLQMKKSEDPVIKTLTKQSIKISNDNEAQNNIPKGDDKKDVKEDKQININDKKDEKVIEQPIPIVLIMNDQTKRIHDSEHVDKQTNQSNLDVAAVRRDILEEHQRDKRMAEAEEIGALKTVFNQTREDKKENISDETLGTDNKEEICNKKEIKSEATSKEDKIQFDILRDDQHPENLIKTSAYLSQQDIVKKVSIDPDLTVGGNFVKLKKRDLKTLKFDDDNEE